MRSIKPNLFDSKTWRGQMVVHVGKIMFPNLQHQMFLYLMVNRTCTHYTGTWKFDKMKNMHSKAETKKDDQGACKI